MPVWRSNFRVALFSTVLLFCLCSIVLNSLSGVFTWKNPVRYYKVNRTAVRRQYGILPKPCHRFDRSIWLVIAVISKPGGYNQRQAIRRTWGSWAKLECGARLIFVLGRIYDAVKQRNLLIEAEVHKDILQSNLYHDTYRASSLKTLSLFQWCAGFCDKSIYLLRIDDDVWLHVPQFTRFLTHHTTGETAVGIPLLSNLTKVARDPSRKYYVPREEFAPNLYPLYFSGALFAVPTSYLAALIHASRTRPTVFLDDVYVGGILMPAVDLPLTPMPDYADYESLPKNSSCPHAGKMSVHHVGRDQLYSFWQSRQCLNSTEQCFTFEGKHVLRGI